MNILSRIRARIGVTDRAALAFWVALAAIYLPIALYLQLAYLPAPLIEPHLRQDQTALTTFYFARHEIPFLDYRSPFEGRLWNEVHELPVYQWVCARLMNLGLSLEVASRGVGLLSYFGGLLLFTLIVRELFDRQTAAWAALMYATSPFSVIFSRAALIDYPCLFFVLLAFWSLLRSLDPERKRFPWWLAVFFLSGSLVAAIKSTLWLFPAVASSIYVLWLFWQRPEQRPALIWIGTLLIAQGIVAVAWTMYANDLQRINGTYGRDFWIFGTLSDRLNPTYWKYIFNCVGRLILYDWMILPFLVGVAYCRRNPFAQVSLAILIVSVLLFFRVLASNQDYYFLVQAPFLFLLAGSGMSILGKGKPLLRHTALGALALLLIFKTVKLPYVLGNIVRPSTERLADGLAIKQLTDPKDIVLFDEIVLGSGYEITLYSERYLYFPSGNAQTELEPTVLHFDDKRAHFDRLKKFPTIWIDALSGEFYVYRTKPEGNFRFDAGRHLAVSVGRPTVGDAIALPEKTTFPVATCQALRPRILELKKVPSEIVLKVVESGRSIVLPGRGFLSLPNHSTLGCRFEVSLVEKPVPVGG